nr:immunoglobulin light chain junction region [Macaca mulatta]MOW43488.1 immunoglobulin light chain junction region [Macaca mulatta]
CQQAFSHPFTF